MTYNVLVTGVGAIIGYGIVNSLRASRYHVRITGIDIYDDAVGQRWCDSFEQAVLTKTPGYAEFLRNIIRKHSIDLVIPGIEQDVSWMSDHSNVISEAGAKFVLNDTKLVKIADDKWLTHEELVKNGLPVIRTLVKGDFTDASAVLGVPMLMKPRRSYASKGIVRLNDVEEYAYWKKKLGDNFMIQEIVGDDNSEFTVAVFGQGDGSHNNEIMLQRRLSVEGATSRARVVFDADLRKATVGLVRVFKPVGPTNFQFRRHDGEYLLLEINPRVSSSTSIRTAFGYNEAEMCITYYLEGRQPEPCSIKQGRASRYIADWIINDSDHL